MVSFDGASTRPPRVRVLALGSEQAVRVVRIRDTWLLQALVVATALIVLGACGGSSAHRSRATTTTEAPSTTTAPRTSSSVRGPAPSTKETFVGHWSVHDAQLNIESNTAAIETINCSLPCLETDTLALSLSTTGTRMTVTIAKITFADQNTGKVIPNPHPADSQMVGDSYYLEFVAPHLMKETIINSSLPAIDQTDDNPYWCGSGLASSLVHLCGA